MARVPSTSSARARLVHEDHVGPERQQARDAELLLLLELQVGRLRAQLRSFRSFQRPVSVSARSTASSIAGRRSSRDGVCSRSANTTLS